MALKNFIFDDIGLGLNTLGDPYELRPGESADLLNVLPASKGETFKRRDGYVQWNTSLATSHVGNLYDWPSAGLIIVSHDDYIKSTPYTGASAWTTRYTGTASPHWWEFELAKNNAGVEMLWAVNGGWDTPQKWNGVAATTSNWTQVPQSATCLRLWKNRMVANDPNFPERLFYSPVGDPEGVWQSIDIRSSYDDSDPITWLELIGDNLLVFKRNSVWLVYDINTFANRRLGYPGVPHRQLSANLNGIVYYANEDNLWATDGVGEPKLVDAKVDLTQPEDDIAWGAFHLVADPEQQRLLYVRKSYVTGNYDEMYAFYPPRTTNNRRDEGTWWKLQFANGAFRVGYVTARLTGATALNKHLMVATYTGSDLYYLMENAADDDGTTITARWKSGVVQLTQMERVERIRRCNLRVVPNVQVTFSAPGATDVVSSVTTVDSGGYVMLRPEIHGREFQIRFDNVAKSSFTVRDIEFAFRGGREHKR